MVTLLLDSKREIVRMEFIVEHLWSWLALLILCYASLSLGILFLEQRSGGELKMRSIMEVVGGNPALFWTVFLTGIVTVLCMVLFILALILVPFV